MRSRNFLSRNALRRIGQVFLMADDHFVAEPVLDYCVTLKQRTHAVATDLVDGCMAPDLIFPPVASARSRGSVMVNCCVFCMVRFPHHNY